MFQIQPYKSIKNRPCSYCLSLQGGSVFADFNIDKNECLYLVRISFDGYGCCQIQADNNLKKIKREDSQFLIKEIETNGFQSLKPSEILISYFNEISESLWKDALLEHNLI